MPRALDRVYLCPPELESGSLADALSDADAEALSLSRSLRLRLPLSSSSDESRLRFLRFA